MVTLSLFCKGSECSIPSATYWESGSKGQLSLSFPTYDEGNMWEGGRNEFFHIKCRVPQRLSTLASCDSNQQTAPPAAPSEISVQEHTQPQGLGLEFISATAWTLRGYESLLQAP